MNIYIHNFFIKWCISVILWLRFLNVIKVSFFWWRTFVSVFISVLSVFGVNLVKWSPFFVLLLIRAPSFDENVKLSGCFWWHLVEMCEKCRKSLKCAFITTVPKDWGKHDDGGLHLWELPGMFIVYGAQCVKRILFFFLLSLERPLSVKTY